MPIVGIGVDVVDLQRFATSVERTPSLAERLLTPTEAGLPLASMAARFAAKEALAKAMREPTRLDWHDVEVVTDEHGAPSFSLRGAAPERLDELGIRSVHLSISHDAGVATAFVVAEC